MAPSTVIDLISSSPSPPSRVAQPPNPLLPPKRNANGDRRNDSPTTAAPLDTDLFSDFTFSDDEETSSDRRKRQRRKSRDHISGPPLQLKSNLPKDTTILNISSSLEQNPDDSLPHGSIHSRHDEKSAALSKPRAPSATHLGPSLDSDPFASSPPRQRAQNAAPLLTRVMSLDTSRDAGKKCGKISLASTNKRADVVHISDSDMANSSSDDELPEISTMNFSARPIAPRAPSTLQRSRSENITSSRPLKRNASETSNASRQVDKKARAAAKAAEQENKRRQRELAKEARSREKNRAAALAEVNKLRTDKKVSTPEMIVDIASGMALDHRAQVEVLLEELGVEFTTWEHTRRSAVKWRRTVTSRYNDDLDRWEPIEPRIHKEKHVLIILTAENLVNLALKHGLNAYADETRQIFDGCSIIYILQGMTARLRKNRNLRSRQFTSRVRSVGQELESNASGASSARQRSSSEYVREELVEDALLRLQIDHNALIHHTVTTTETAKWIATFTQHISTVPYKRQREFVTSAAGFCMESGQIRTGEDAKDTYIKMLQENSRVTAPIAFGIASEFGTVTQLVRGLDAGGPMRLDGVRKCANRDGQLSDRAIGQAMSRRLHKIFTGRDDTSTDV